MFDTLEKQIEETEGSKPSTSSILIKYLIILVATVVVFGGLYMAIRLVE